MGFSLLGCEMLPAEVLSAPRILAIRATPPVWRAGARLELEALVWNVDAEVVWSACPTAWAPTDPISCPSGAAVSLGRGNPHAVELDVAGGELWLKAEAGTALPAVQLLKVDSQASNPVLEGIFAEGGAPLPTSASPGVDVALAVVFADSSVADNVVTSWYVSGGELLPARTVGTTPTIWTMPDAPSDAPLTLIGVSRAVAGGVTWTVRTLEVN